MRCAISYFNISVSSESHSAFFFSGIVFLRDVDHFHVCKREVGFLLALGGGFFPMMGAAGPGLGVRSAISYSNVSTSIRKVDSCAKKW